MSHLWIALPLLVGWPTEESTVAPVAARAASVEGEVELLLAEYEQAVGTWNAEYRDVDEMSQRRALKARHPALTYWPKFEALSEAGEGRALLWMAQNLRERGLKMSDARAEEARLFGVLAQDYLQAEWFGDVLEALPDARRSLGDEKERGIYRAVIERNPHRELQAHAIYRLAKVLGESPEAGLQAEAVAWMTRLAQDYAETEHGEQAVGALFEMQHLALGKVAPDFEARTIDGHAFKLSDYRGKVVLVDFYGFW